MYPKFLSLTAFAPLAASTSAQSISIALYRSNTTCLSNAQADVSYTSSPGAGCQRVNLFPDGEYKAPGAFSAKVASTSPGVVLRLFDDTACSDSRPDEIPTGPEVINLELLLFRGKALSVSMGQLRDCESGDLNAAITDNTLDYSKLGTPPAAQRRNTKLRQPRSMHCVNVLKLLLGKECFQLTKKGSEHKNEDRDSKVPKCNS
ncbi:hypothetical protein B0O99DRAFT_727460 [Bisporella sp. PMI_857]|nr:hypothetical protein B0O99DRAFT_727460 [Bisporella sp. PMI_857]